MILTAASLAGALVSGRTVFYTLFYMFVVIIALSLFWAWTGVHRLALRRQMRARLLKNVSWLGMYIEARAHPVSPRTRTQLTGARPR